MTIKYNLYLLLLFFFAVNFFSAQSNDKFDQFNQNLNLIDSAFQKGEIGKIWGIDHLISDFVDH